MHMLYDLQTFEHTVPYHVKLTCTFAVLYYVVELTADETEYSSEWLRNNSFGQPRFQPL